MSNTYWSGNGKHQEWYDLNFSQLVPASGETGTVEGELIRASAKLYYDYYNNGMCNNTSGPANFLTEYDIKYKLGISKQIHDVRLECNTGGYTTAELSKPLEDIVNVVIEFAQSKNGVYTPTTDDMWLYQDNEWEQEDFNAHQKRQKKSKKAPEEKKK
jgi:hypothetical protein